MPRFARDVLAMTLAQSGRAAGNRWAPVRLRHVTTGKLKWLEHRTDNSSVVGSIPTPEHDLSRHDKGTKVPYQEMPRARWWLDARKASHQFAARVSPGSCPSIGPVTSVTLLVTPGNVRAFHRTDKSTAAPRYSRQEAFPPYLKHGDGHY